MIQIVSRSEWGARKPKSRYPIELPAPEVWIHHSATRPGSDYRAHTRMIQNYHMDQKRWSDIAYSFLIYPNGEIHEGRGWGVAGGHTAGRNTVSHGICFVGNFQEEKPTDAAIASGRALIREGIHRGVIANRTQPTGPHKDAPKASTACAGVHLNSRISELSHLFAPSQDPIPQENMNVVPVNHPPVKTLVHGAWKGYIQVTADGGVFNFGEAPFYGSLGNVKLAAPIIDAVVTPSGKGYILTGADGGIFAFGDAEYAGRVEYAAG